MKKSTVLLAMVVSLAAAILPSTASAGSWSFVGTQHTLVATNLTVRMPALSATVTCTHTELDAHVQMTQLVITTAVITGCTGDGAGAGCAITSARANGLNWTAPATATNNIPLNGMDVDFAIGAGTCAFPSRTLKIAGNLAAGVWSVGSKSIIYTNATGLAVRLNGTGFGGATVTMLLTDVVHTLIFND